MPDVLYRYDEPTHQWVQVTSVNRIEVSGGGVVAWVDFITGYIIFPLPITTNIDMPII